MRLIAGCALAISLHAHSASATPGRHAVAPAVHGMGDVQNDGGRCASTIVDATELDADIGSGASPQFALYVPNTGHDGHDTGVATADAWLRERSGPLIADDRFMSGTLLVVTFDDGSMDGPDIVLYGGPVAASAVSAGYYDHYSLLRTIEEIFGTGTLHRHDDTAQPISGIWRR